MHLLLSDEPVCKETARYKLVDARCQLRPFTDPCFEIGIAAIASPSGPRIAGQHGVSLLSIGATLVGDTRPAGDALGRRRGAGRRVRHDRVPRRLAARRADAHRRDHASRRGRRRVRHRRVVRLPPAHGRRAAVPPARRHARGAHRLGQRERRRRDRHAGGRDQQDRRAVQAVQRRLRVLPDDGPRVGPARRRRPPLRAVRPARDAEVPGLGRPHAGRRALRPGHAGTTSTPSRPTPSPPGPTSTPRTAPTSPDPSECFDASECWCGEAPHHALRWTGRSTDDRDPRPRRRPPPRRPRPRCARSGCRSTCTRPGEAMVLVAPDARPCAAEDVCVELRPGDRRRRVRFWAHVRSAGPREYLVHEWEYGGYERQLDCRPASAAGSRRRCTTASSSCGCCGATAPSALTAHPVVAIGVSQVGSPPARHSGCTETLGWDQPRLLLRG